VSDPADSPFAAGRCLPLASSGTGGYERHADGNVQRAPDALMQEDGAFTSFIGDRVSGCGSKATGLPEENVETVSDCGGFCGGG